MTRALYAFRDGKLVEIARDYDASPSAAFVHDDTLKTPLKNPVNGKMYDSKSAYLEDCKRLGLRVVGNDLLSKKTQKLRDTITDERIMDRIEKAESIYGDPSKFRARQFENQQRLERAQKLLNERR